MPCPRLTAVICTYDRHNVLAGAISSLLAQQGPPGLLEILVIDNSPNQQSAAAFGANYQGIANLRYVLEPQPGISRARNIGIALAAADIVGFIDDDAIASPNWASAIVEGFAEFGPRAGAVGGPVRARFVSERPAWVNDDTLSYLGIFDRGGKLREIRHINALVGCNMALDKQLVTSLGGFSTTLGRIGGEATLLSNEEPELFTKIMAAGRALVFAPDAEVAHIINPQRLNQNWFLRRAAWQAVSDYLMDPAKARSDAENPPAHLKSMPYPANPRHPSGAAGQVPDAAAFFARTRALYYATLANLAGGIETPEDPQPAPTLRPWAQNLRTRHRQLAGQLPAYRRLAIAIRPILRALGPILGAGPK